MPFEYSVLHADFNEIVPLGPWIVLLGMVLPPLVLFLRPLLPINSPMCFVDAASINQTDQVLMERGIYGEKVSLRENEDKAQACGKTRAQQLTLQRHRPEWTKKGLLRFRDRRRKLTCYRSLVLPVMTFGWIGKLPGRTRSNELFTALSTAMGTLKLANDRIREVVYGGNTHLDAVLGQRLFARVFKLKAMQASSWTNEAYTSVGQLRRWL